MDIGGGKARRSGKELSFAKSYTNESFEQGVLTIQVSRIETDWKQWIKTIGNVTFLENGNVEVLCRDKLYHIEIAENTNGLTATVVIGKNTQKDIYFMSELKTVFRKTAYCIGCRVCEANCPHGFISMKDGHVTIDDRCVKCKKCHDVFHGCLVANSLRLPKGEKKMGSMTGMEIWALNSIGLDRISN